jgi:alkylation response protein AidB-like acyl-CoA dehydrogenase
MKLAYSRHVAATADLLMALQGPAGMLGVIGAPDEGFWQQQFLSQWSIRIGGGTDQIQRNILGERVLGLPREPMTEAISPSKPATRTV